MPLAAIFIAGDQPTKPIFPWHPESEGAYTSLTPAALDTPLLESLKPEHVIVPEYALNADCVRLVTSRFPKTRCGCWIFAERSDFHIDDFRSRLAMIAPEQRGFMIVDRPAEFKKALGPA